MSKTGNNYSKYKCPCCGEAVIIEKVFGEETLRDWMDEYGWYRIRKDRYVCPDCYYEGFR